jgi:hypothetical protein
MSVNLASAWEVEDAVLKDYLTGIMEILLKVTI